MRMPSFVASLVSSDACYHRRSYSAKASGGKFSACRFQPFVSWLVNIGHMFVSVDGQESAYLATHTTCEAHGSVQNNSVARIHNALLMAVNNTYHDGLLTISFL